MDSAVLSATSGLIGSLVGGVSTFAASWLTTRYQPPDGCVESPGGGPRGDCQAVGRRRPNATVILTGLIKAAEEVVYAVLEAYAAPNHTFDDLRHRAQPPKDPLRNFSEACRADLLAAGD